jgi:phosphoribosyl 1,2-cyclic phosphodiesterase
VDALTGATIKACDLRAGAACVIAGLAARGATTIEGISYIERATRTLWKSCVPWARTSNAWMSLTSPSVRSTRLNAEKKSGGAESAGQSTGDFQYYVRRRISAAFFNRINMKNSHAGQLFGGNCTLVSQGDTHLLIDCGISMRRIRSALRELDLTPEVLSGILMTHEHSDHTCGLKMMAKYFGTRIFATRVTGEDLCSAAPELSETVTLFEAGSRICVGELDIGSFRTLHDAPESVGYRIEGGGRTLAFATDLGCVTREVLEGVRGADMAIIEANHDVQMLRSGPYPYPLKRRILSDHGHLSNDASAVLARALADSGARRLVLAHLSEENNTPRKAADTVSAALRELGADTELDVRPPGAPER